MDHEDPAPDIPPSQPIAGRRFATSLDWNLLRTFHEIVQAGGISRAAKATSRKQPALSMALRRLEEMLDATLCHRGPGGFYLTQEGEMLAETCERIFGTIATVPSRFASSTAEVRGRVRVQMISNLVDPAIDQVLQRFHQLYPAVEMFVTVSPWEVVPRVVLRNAADLGIAPAQVRVPSLRYEPLFTEVYQPYCGALHPLFGEVFEDPRDLAGHGVIHTGADEPEQLTTFRLKYGIGKHIAGLAERIEEARRLTILSVGICFLPQALAQPDVEAGRLHALLKMDGAPSSKIFLISNPDAPTHRARDMLMGLFRAKDGPAASGGAAP